MTSWLARCRQCGADDRSCERGGLFVNAAREGSSQGERYEDVSGSWSWFAQRMEVSNHQPQCQIENGVFPLAQTLARSTTGDWQTGVRGKVKEQIAAARAEWGSLAASTSEKPALVEQVVAEQQLRTSPAQAGEPEHISRDETRTGLFGGCSMGTLVATGLRLGRCSGTRAQCREGQRH